MALSPNQIIATMCPELSGSPSLPTFLAMAVEQTDRGFYGVMYNRAVALRACHEFTMTAGNAMKNIMDKGGGAPIASMSEGGLAVSFAQGGSDGSDLGSTKYGKMLLALRKSRPRMGVNTGGFIW
jgi:hypothetical protein